MKKQSNLLITQNKVEIKSEIKKEQKPKKRKRRNPSSKDTIVQLPIPQIQTTVSTTTSDSSCGSSPSLMNSKLFS